MKIVILEGDSVGRDVSWDRLKKFGKVICYAATPTIACRDKNS